MREEILRFDDNTQAGGGLVKMKMMLASIVIAVTGGSVQWMRHSKQNFSWIALVTVLLTSAFAGMQAHFFLRWLEVPESLMYGIVGMVGYGSGTLLDAAIPLMVRWAHRRLGLEPPVPHRRKEDVEEVVDGE